MIKIIFAITLVLLIVPSLSGLYKLVKHSQERGAACLDGSPAGLYIHEGSGVNKTKYLIYFNGGGFCGGKNLAQTLQSCYTRSSTNLGTTNVYNQTYSFDGSGILSTLQKQNPHFYDWTKVFAIYCDGASHQGYRQAPIEYKNKDLYFRGTRNVLEHFYYLDKQYDFYNGDMIVVTGVSAGGMGAYQWSNYVYENSKKAKVYSIPDSGLFITNYYSPIVGEKVLSTRIESLFKLVSSESSLQLPSPVRTCLESQQFYGDFVACFDAGNYAQHQKAPMLIVQSPYDEWCLNNILIVKCLLNSKAPYSLTKCNSTTMTAIDQYRKQAINTLKKMKGSRRDVGAWGPSCVQHGYISYSSVTSSNFKIPSGTGLTLNDVIGQFLTNPDQAPWMIQEVAWPENKGCSGVAASMNLKTNSIIAYD